MAEYDNTNRFSIWKNEKKEKEGQPDFTGDLDVDGVKYFVDAWKRREGSSAKAPPLSGKIKRKDQQPPMRGAIPGQTYADVKGRSDSISSGLDDDDMDGDRIPF